LLKIATQGVSLWHYIYIYIIYIYIINIYILYPDFVHLLYFYSFYLSPFLMVVSTGLKILYLFLCREYINHIHFLTSFFYLSPLVTSP
jgi:hypothetical protein